MPDLRPAASTAVLLAALPLGNPTVAKERLTSWINRGARPVERMAGGSAAIARGAAPAALTAIETEVLRVVKALTDMAPSITPARAVVLTVDALSLGSQALCLAALATLGDSEYLAR